MSNNGFTSYADDNKPYSIGNDIEDIIQRLQATSKNIFFWFLDKKWELMLRNVIFFLALMKKLTYLSEMEKLKTVKILSAKSNSKLTINTHVNDISKTAGQELNTWTRVTPYLDFDIKGHF